jgi:hypothetical protein
MTSLRPLLQAALIHLVVVVPLCAIGTNAIAQATAVAIPAKADCGAKPPHPGRVASDTQRRVWQKEANEYLGCYKKYVLIKQQAAQDMTKAANDAIDEYNETVKEFEAAVKAAD